MKRKLCTFVVISVLIVVFIAVIQVVELANANPINWFHTDMAIYLSCPQNGAAGLPFPINFTSKSNFVINLADGSAFFYVLDGQTVATSGIRFTQLQNIVGTDLGGQANLTGIAPGFHTITVYYVGNVRTNSPQNDYMYATSSVKSATSVFFIESETPAPTPTLSPSPSASPSPTLSPTPLPTISATAAMTPTETQQPTSSPNPTVPTPSISGTPPIINIFIGVAALVIFTAVAAGVLLYLKKRQ